MNKLLYDILMSAKLWLCVGGGFIFAAIVNTLIEAAKQRKTPNEVVRDWTEEQLPRIIERAENSEYGRWKDSWDSKDK